MGVDKKRYLTLAVIIIAAVFAAFIIEYCTNGARTIPSGQRTLISTEAITYELSNAEVDSAGNIIMLSDDAEIKISSKNIRVVRISFDDVKRSKFYIEYEGNRIEDTGRNVPQVEEKTSGIHSVEVNGEDECVIHIQNRKSVVTSIEIDNRYIRNWYLIAAIIILGIIISIGYLSISCEKITADRLFIISALVIVMAFSTILPVTTSLSWDEHIHFSRGALLAIGDTTQIETDLGVLKHPFTNDIELNKEDLSTWSEDECPTTDELVSTGDFSQTNILLIVYNLCAYIPVAAVLSLYRLLGMSSVVAYVLGRAISGAFYSIVCFLGIRKLKTGKTIYSILALCPLAVFQATTYTYDWWSTAFIFMGTAYLIGAMQSDEIIGLKDYAIMLAAFVIGCGPKAIYFLLILGLIMLGKDKFRTLKQYRGNIAISIFTTLCVAGTFMLPFLIAGPGTGDARGGSEVNAAEQVAYIFSHPLDYTVTLIKHIIGYIFPGNIARYFISLYNLLPQTIYTFVIGIILVLLLVIAIITDVDERDTDVLGIKNRITVWFISFATICLISTALYISFTPVGSSTIEGVQGRYLMPMSIFLLMFCRPTRPVIRSFNIKRNGKLYSKSMITISAIFPAIILIAIANNLY